jgi:hypothetical protein
MKEEGEEEEEEEGKDVDKLEKMLASSGFMG